MAKDKIFIEPRADGGFGAKHERGKRAVVTGETQREVIDQTKARYPEATDGPRQHPTRPQFALP